MRISVDEYRKRVKKTASEADVQTMVCRYLRSKGVPFRTDKDGQFVSGYSRKIKSEHKGLTGFPDLVIPLQRGGYGGLVLELKKEGVRVYKKDGEIREDEHLKQQQWWLDWFSAIGCKASFACGYDEAIKIIDEYIQQNLHDNRKVHKS